MKTITRNAWRILLAVAVTFAVAGCDDGVMGSGASLDITPPAPMVIKFAADPGTIKSGESTTISWEVAGADKVKIAAVSVTGEPVSFSVESEELSGSAPATLTSTTDFVLTATKSSESLESEESDGDEADVEKGGQIQFGPDEEPAVEPSVAVSEVTQTITVTVVESTELMATITADHPSINSGDQTVIRWKVDPSENVSTVVVADSGEVFDPTDQCEGTIADIAGQVGVDPTPSVGCAVVIPTSDTTYTVTGTDASGATATASVTVDVKSPDISADVWVGATDGEQKKNLGVSSFNDPIYVSWKVEPGTATVTITATPSVIDCALPTDSTEVTGSVPCKIGEKTSFHLIAKVGDAEKTDDAEVYRSAGGNAGLAISEQWAFQGETVAIPMSLTTTSNPDVIAKVKVGGQEIDSSFLEKLKAGDEIVVEQKAGSISMDVEIYDETNPDPLFSKKAVEVVKMLVDELGDDERRLSSFSYNVKENCSGDDCVTRYVGVELKGFNGGIARYYVNGKHSHINFVDPIRSAFDMDAYLQDAFFEAVDAYPTVVAVREGNKSDEIYIGMTGLLMRKIGVNGEPKKILTLRRQNPYDSDPDDGDPPSWDGDPSHPTCGRNNETGGQKTQPGKDPEWKDGGDFISLDRICDVIATSEGRVIVATDYGVQTEQNIDSGDSNTWIGTPAIGMSGEDEKIKALTYSHVVNDLEKVDNRIFAALGDPRSPNAIGTTGNGVVVSTDGIHWEDFGRVTFDAPVYALSYDPATKTIYAAAEQGLYKSPVDSVSWESVDTDAGGAVASVAVDPASNGQTIIVGTESGIEVTRNGGANWYPLIFKKDVSDDDDESAISNAVDVLAIAVMEKGNEFEYHIAIGMSKNGYKFQSFSLGKVE